VLAARGYLAHTPSVPSRLSGRPKVPWILALTLMSAAFLYFGMILLLSPFLAAMYEAGSGETVTVLEFAPVWGICVVLLLCIWTAWYRPMAAALLLLAMWISGTITEVVQYGPLATPGESEAEYTWAIWLSPSLIVALLLVATSRSLSRLPQTSEPAQQGPVDSESGVEE
jgi:hypothetical protein